jgi:glycerol uptake facilitator-like aquaporin
VAWYGVLAGRCRRLRHYGSEARGRKYRARVALQYNTDRGHFDRVVLIFGPLSGAHFNPAVSLAFALRGELLRQTATAYIVVQIVGAIVGVWAAHLMFEVPVWQLSATVRAGPGQWFAEAVATFGLLLTICGCVARTAAAVPYAVGLYITSAYWFTASTSFANPAVTIARSLSDTFARVAPPDVLAFISAQLVGAGAAVLASRWLRTDSREPVV